MRRKTTARARSPEHIGRRAQRRPPLFPATEHAQQHATEAHTPASPHQAPHLRHYTAGIRGLLPTFAPHVLLCGRGRAPDNGSR
ncbi:protein of unknown function [Burkholderia multivorans]